MDLVRPRSDKSLQHADGHAIKWIASSMPIWFVLQGTPAWTNQKGPWVKGADRTLEGNAEEAQAFAETAQKKEQICNTS